MVLSLSNHYSLDSVSYNTIFVLLFVNAVVRTSGYKFMPLANLRQIATAGCEGVMGVVLLFCVVAVLMETETI